MGAPSGIPFTRRSPRLVVVISLVPGTPAFVLVRSPIKGLVFAGPYAGLFAGDQLLYLVWIWETGLHVLIADPYGRGAARLSATRVLISGPAVEGRPQHPALLPGLDTSRPDRPSGGLRKLHRPVPQRPRAGGGARPQSALLLSAGPAVRLWRDRRRQRRQLPGDRRGPGAPCWQAWGFLGSSPSG